MSVGLCIAVILLGVAVLLAVLVALFRSGKPIRGLVSTGAQGVCALAAVNVVGAVTGVSLGLNVFTGVGCLVLGIPGVVTMLLLKLIFNA